MSLLDNFKGFLKSTGEVCKLAVEDTSFFKPFFDDAKKAKEKQEKREAAERDAQMAKDIHDIAEMLRRR